MHAEIRADAAGTGTLLVGFAPARRLEPAVDSAGEQVWRAGGLTVRVDHEAGAGDAGAGEPGLLISLLGAHHVRFGRVASAPAGDAITRGLRIRQI